MSFHLARRRTAVLAGLAAVAVMAGVSTAGSGGVVDTRPSYDGDYDPLEPGPRTAPVGDDHSSHARAQATQLRAHGGDHAAAGHEQGAAASTTSGSGLAVQPAQTAGVLDPAVYGKWETKSYDLPLRTVHATALKTGELLLIAGSGNNPADNVIGNFKAYLFNPDTGALTSKPVPYDAFCAYHVVDANGDVLVIGGTDGYVNGSWRGTRKVVKYVVDTGTWVTMPSMISNRWYAAAATDGDDKTYVYSGRNRSGTVTTTAEVYDPVARTWTALPARPLPMYAALFTNDQGRLVYTGAHYGSKYGTTAPSIFDPVTGAGVAVTGTMTVQDREQAASTMVGSAERQTAWVAGGGFPAQSSTYFIDMNAAAPAAIPGPSLPVAKAYVSTATLPDATTLETGGGAARQTPVFETSILNPDTRTLTSMAPPTQPRGYHSSALTTIKGQVVTFGDDPGEAGQPEFFNLKVEVFSPPYLFQGTRPVITAAPTELAYGGTYAIKGSATTGSTLTSATLLRPASATHSTNSSERILELPVTRGSDGVTVTLPTNRNVALPGWYYLSVLDDRGRPSVGKAVHLAAPGAGGPPVSTAVPAAPVIGTAASGAAGNGIFARANWSAPPSDGGSPITGYRVFALRVDESGNVLQTIQSGVRPAAERSYLMGLPVIGSYRFEVVAINAVGTGPRSASSNVVTGQ